MPCLELESKLKLTKQLQSQNKTVSNDIALTMWFRFTRHAWESGGTWTLCQTVLLLSALHPDWATPQSTPTLSPSTFGQSSSSSSSSAATPTAVDNMTTRGPLSPGFSSQPKTEDGNFVAVKIVVSSLGVFLVGSVIIFLLYTWKKLAPSQWR